MDDAYPRIVKIGKCCDHLALSYLLMARDREPKFITGYVRKPKCELVIIDPATLEQRAAHSNEEIV